MGTTGCTDQIAVEYRSLNPSTGASNFNPTNSYTTEWPTLSSAPDRKDVGTLELGDRPRAPRRRAPARDFADPSRTGHPKHMDSFRHLRPGERPSRAMIRAGSFNSNIHNKAVHNLLTMTKEQPECSASRTSRC
jgi:hypothetical protein